MNDTTEEAAPEAVMESLTRAAVVPMQMAAVRYMNPGTQMMMAAQQDGKLDLPMLKELMALQKDWEKHQAEQAFHAAMAEFAAKRPTVIKDKKVGFSTKAGDKASYSHASIGNLIETVSPVLGECGLSHTWETLQEGMKVTVTCILTHKRGHSIRRTLTGTATGTPMMSEIQKISAAITQLERYTFQLATGTATKDQIDYDDVRHEEVARPTEEQIIKLEEWMEALEVNKQVFFDHFGVQTLDDLTMDAYNEARTLLANREKDLDKQRGRK